MWGGVIDLLRIAVRAEFRFEYFRVPYLGKKRLFREADTESGI